jgi:hypothetical protein
MVHGWLVGFAPSPVVGVSDGGREGVEEMEMERTVLRKPKNRHHSAFVLPSPFSISKVWNILERKTGPNWVFKLVLVSYIL